MLTRIDLYRLQVPDEMLMYYGNIGNTTRLQGYGFFLRANAKR